MKTFLILFLLLSIANLFAQSDLDFDKLNELYYNINDYGFNGFSADVEFDLLGQLKNSLKEENKIDILNKIAFKVDMFSKDSIDFNIIGIEVTGDEKFDQGLSQMVIGAEQTVKGFLLSWSESSCAPPFEPAKYNYLSSTESNITTVMYEQEGSAITIFLSNLASIDSIYMNNETSDVKVYPFYEKTDFNKRIIKSLVTSINNLMEVKMDVEYKYFNKIMIPELITVSSKLMNSNQVLNFRFNNIVLN